MNGVGVLLAALALQGPGADSLRALALHLPEAALVSEIRARPLLVRDGITEALARSVKGPATEHDEALKVARVLAAGYAAAWQDSFLVREVARFREWPAQLRASKVWADSVRLAGNAEFGRAGPAAAIRIWRRGLARYLTIPDSAGTAAALINIGSALLDAGRPDSAQSYLERARRLAAAIGDLRAEAAALGALAGASEDRGDLARARQGYARALALHERVGDTRGIAADHNNLGLLAQGAGDLNEARQELETALALNRREGRDEVAATNLVNLAGLASLEADFARAEDLYHDALATWRARGLWSEAAAALDGLGQLELRRGDYPAAGNALREALSIYDRSGDVTNGLAVRRALASGLAAAGDLQGALDQLHRAQFLADSARAPADSKAGVVLARADLAVSLNASAEAERLYTQAVALYSQADDANGAADARQGLAALLLGRADHARVQQLLDAALRTQEASGNRRSAALTRISLGNLSAARGDTAGARRQLTRAAAELDRVGDPVDAAEALGERARVEAAAGLPALAATLYERALQRLGDHLAPDVAWRLHAGVGLAWRARGSSEAAAREFRAALAELQQAGRSLALPDRRSGFLADKWGVYTQLALTEHARNRDGAAFDLSERLRAREMLDMLAEGRVAAPAGVPAELVTREQDLRRRIAELTRDLERPDPGAVREAGHLRGPDLASASGAARDALLRAQEDYADLLRDIRERAPRHAALVAPPTAEWRDVARRLSPDEALIEYLVSDSASLAFVVTRDTLAAVDLGVGRRELAQLVEFTRGTLQPEAVTSGDALWRAPLRRLYGYLIAPVEATGLLNRTRRLVLVPHAELHYLPFAALLEDRESGAFLVQRYELSETPSASVWLALGDRRASRAEGILAVAPRSDLPGARREVAAIARLGGDSVLVLSGKAATKEAFLREAPTRRVLHLATYGVLNRQNPLFSFVDLAPRGADDGRLEVHDVFGLSLAADLVVLSACQTGLGSGALADVPTGDDWVGLTRAFLDAGAARVMATLWPVDDWATAGLMEQFYRNYFATGDPVAALAAAQRATLALAATAHPSAWAGFVIAEGADPVVPARTKTRE